MTEKKGGQKTPLIVHPTSDGFTISGIVGTQSIPNNASTPVSLWTTTAASPSPKDFLAQPTNTTWTCVHSGYYLVCGGASFQNNAVGSRQITIMKGASANFFVQVPNAGGADTSSVTTSGILKLASGDTVSINVFQNSGVALTIGNTYFGLMPVCEKMCENFL